MLTHTENRRAISREKSFQKTTYSDSFGAVYRTQVINQSSRGARLTTKLEVKVGDQIFIRQQLASGAIIEVPVEVKWTKPAGLCQVVGVRILERLPQLVSQVA